MKPILAAVLIALTLSTGTARADDQSYIDDLRAHGALGVPGFEGGWIGDGHRMCNELRSGVSRANVQTVANHNVYAGESTFLLN